MAREEVREKNRFYAIIEGTFRTQVDKDDPTAVRRDWKSADGKSSGTKYERVINSIIGYIEDIQFRDSEYGTEIQVALDKGADDYVPVVSLKLSSREGEDFLKKLPNINLLKEVKLRPFNFTDPNDGDEVRGMSVMQEDERGEFKVKIENYFWDKENKTEVNGFPTPEGDTENYSKDDWKIYFLQTRKFLKTFTIERMCAKVAQAVIDRGEGVVATKAAEPVNNAVMEDEPAPKEDTGEVDPSLVPPEKPKSFTPDISKEDFGTQA